jgi:hypothetical protein
VKKERKVSGFRVNWHRAESMGQRAKRIGQRAKGLGLRGDFVGGGDEEHAEKGIMNKEFKKEKR